MSRTAIRLASAVLLAGTALAGCGSAPTEVAITIRYSAFEPTQLHVNAGEPVTFVLVNADPIDHEWLVGDEAFHAAHRTGTHESHHAVPTEVTVPARETVRTTITFDEPGSYAYICHLPGHESYGMVGLLVVEG